mmetsp:Transcript_7415/g.17572  ORF Transcript_7415/g.17572 Transcript_7415/m.17572 type:complete len:245 (-) Transcript_7415:430-1164(-)
MLTRQSSAFMPASSARLPGITLITRAGAVFGGVVHSISRPSGSPLLLSNVKVYCSPSEVGMACGKFVGNAGGRGAAGGSCLREPNSASMSSNSSSELDNSGSNTNLMVLLCFCASLARLYSVLACSRRCLNLLTGWFALLVSSFFAVSASQSGKNSSRSNSSERRNRRSRRYAIINVTSITTMTANNTQMPAFSKTCAADVGHLYRTCQLGFIAISVNFSPAGISTIEACTANVEKCMVLHSTS